MTSCVVLFSGGLDSTTTLAWALRRYDRVLALTFDYGQRHRVEIGLARRAARRLGVPLTVLKVDLRPIGGTEELEAYLNSPSPGALVLSQPKEGPRGPGRMPIFAVAATPGRDS